MAMRDRPVKRIVSLVTLALASTFLYAEETVFGFTLGKRIEAPECPSKTIRGGTKLFDVISKFTCMWDVEQRKDDVLPSRTVVLAFDSAPRFMKGLFRAWLRDDLFVGAEFYTYGIQSQDEAFGQLTTKYGKPTHISKSRVQNLAGASFDAITAEWRRDNLIVLFNGVTNRIDLGEVRIETLELAELRKQQVKEKAKSEIKL